MAATDRLGPLVGLGWRPELAGVALGLEQIGFVEVMAERWFGRSLPLPLEALRRRGVTVVPHAATLSLGGSARPDRRRLSHLAQLARAVDAPFVSEHVAFVRSGTLDAGHLLPLPRTRDALEVLVENVRVAQDLLPVPLALENVAALFEWPEPEMDEADFLTELLERTGALLLLDVANLYANGRNHGFDPASVLDRLPLERLAYVHVAGGIERSELYVDTHAHPVPQGVLQLLGQLLARCPHAPVLLERDGGFPPEAELRAELQAIAATRPVVIGTREE